MASFEIESLARSLPSCCVVTTCAGAVGRRDTLPVQRAKEQQEVVVGKKGRSQVSGRVKACICTRRRAGSDANLHHHHQSSSSIIINHRH